MDFTCQANSIIVVNTGADVSVGNEANNNISDDKHSIKSSVFFTNSDFLNEQGKLDSDWFGILNLNQSQHTDFPPIGINNDTHDNYTLFILKLWYHFK